jgi:predicted HTH transcriptional regulator
MPLHAGTTRLTAQECENYLERALVLLESQPSLNNATLRERFGLTFDQVIRFFRVALDRGVLVKQGNGPSTFYIRARRPDE